MDFEFTDRNGHRLFFEGRSVFLELATEKRPRHLGEVDDGTFFTTRNLERHKMRNGDSIGFNLSLIRYGRFSRVVVRTRDGQELRTTRRWILKHGRTSRPGGKFEVQTFLPVSMFLGFIEPPPDVAENVVTAPANVQGDLFTNN
jgi:hypothetical protein